MNKRNRVKQAVALGAVAVSIIALAAIFTIPVVRAQRGGDLHRTVNVLPPVGITFGQNAQRDLS